MNCKLQGVYVQMHKSSLWNITLKVIFHIKWSTEVKRQSREPSVTSAALARLTLAGSERLINVNLAQPLDTLTKDTYSASSTACSLPHSFLTFGVPAPFPLCDLHFPFFTCIFHLESFILALSYLPSLSSFHPPQYQYLYLTPPGSLHFSQVMVKMAACTAAALHINITSLSDKQKHAYKTL